MAFYNLTRGEFEVMAVLVRNPTAAMTPKILQTKVLITSGGLSNRIKALEAKGYIVRKPDETDGRGVVLKATTKGKNVTRKALKSHLEVEKQRQSPLKRFFRKRASHSKKRLNLRRFCLCLFLWVASWQAFSLSLETTQAIQHFASFHIFWIVG